MKLGFLGLSGVVHYGLIMLSFGELSRVCWSLIPPVMVPVVGRVTKALLWIKKVKMSHCEQLIHSNQKLTAKDKLTPDMGLGVLIGDKMIRKMMTTCELAILVSVIDVTDYDVKTLERPNCCSGGSKFNENNNPGVKLKSRHGFKVDLQRTSFITKSYARPPSPPTKKKRKNTYASPFTFL
ncbi:hypothetical protein Ancab_009001 [Ancistrocladus abbreviatus]